MTLRKEQLLIPVSLKELYVQPGEHHVKFIIDPEMSRSVSTVEVSMWNADGTPVWHTMKRWGTKLNLSFVIDETTPDGVVTISFRLGGKGLNINKRFCFWVIK